MEKQTNEIKLASELVKNITVQINSKLDEAFMAANKLLTDFERWQIPWFKNYLEAFKSRTCVKSNVILNEYRRGLC